MGQPTNTQFAVGVHVLILLGAGRDAPLSSEEMAASVGTNPVYIRRVLGRLREAGLVVSRPGARGGWRLVREGTEITLGDVWRAIVRDDHILGLHASNPACPVGQSVQRTLADIDRQAARAIEAELDRATVDDVSPSPGVLNEALAQATG
jgi:Rrf2 family protein